MHTYTYIHVHICIYKHINKHLKGVGLSVIGLTGPPKCQKNKVEQVTCPLKPFWKIVTPWCIASV